MAAARDDGAVDVGAADDPVAAVLDVAAAGGLLSLRTSGTTSRPRAVLRTAASWTDSFPAVSALTGIDRSARVWVPGPLSSTMNLFAAAHARDAGARVLADPAGATHAHLTPAALTACLRDGVALAGVHVVVAGDRLPRPLADRAGTAGATVSAYYGAAELSFVAWGGAEDDLRPFPGVDVEVRDGLIRVRSPFLSLGYAGGAEGPFEVGADGFATVGDRGSLREGVLTVAGRGTEAVLTGGATVLVADVERVLARACGSEVVVVGVAHPRLGALVAAVLTDPAALPLARRAAREELPSAQRPRRWHVADRLPLTAAGKVDRAALADLLASGGRGGTGR